MAALCFTGFAMACSPLEKHVSHGARLAMMYACSIAGSVFVNAATPLYFELCVEATYPIAEGLTLSALNLMQSVPVTAFTVLPLLTAADASLLWMNWAVVAATLFGALVVLPLDEPRRRLDVDAGHAAAAASSTAVVIPARE